MFAIDVSQHQNCRLRVTVLHKTSAPDGGRRLKLLFSIIAPRGMLRIFDRENEAETSVVDMVTGKVV